MEKVFYFIRKITVPPVLAILFLCTVYGLQPTCFFNDYQLLEGIVFLGILPVLGYPLQRYIPPFKEQGREGQRTLAMLFSMTGYLLGTCLVYASEASKELRLIYGLYFLSGILIFLLNKGFHFRVSGHACGITAPILLFLKFHMLLPAAAGFFIVFFVMLSSVKTKRHTVKQLLGGSMTAVVCMLLLCILFYA